MIEIVVFWFAIPVIAALMGVMIGILIGEMGFSIIRTIGRRLRD